MIRIETEEEKPKYVMDFIQNLVLNARNSGIIWSPSDTFKDTYSAISKDEQYVVHLSLILLGVSEQYVLRVYKRSDAKAILEVNFSNVEISQISELFLLIKEKMQVQVKSISETEISELLTGFFK